MIITRTPFRVSFAGGGSDIREFYSKNGYGAVVSAAIKKYMYIAIHPYFHDKIRIKYSRTEDVDSVEEVEHPIVRECLRKVRIERGIEIASFADVSAGSGLGSSSAFTVGLLNALYAYDGREAAPGELASEACEIEIDILGEPIGKQDQYSAARGGVNYIRFNKDETVEVSPIGLSDEAIRRLEDTLCLYYVGGERSASDILARLRGKMAENDKFEMRREILALVDDMRRALSKEDSAVIGEILHKGWSIKKGLIDGISNVAIDELYEALSGAGASGGKLLGAGGGGFLLMCAKDHAPLKERAKRKALPFEIDREGTKVIFHE